MHRSVRDNAHTSRAFREIRFLFSIAVALSDNYITCAQLYHL